MYIWFLRKRTSTLVVYRPFLKLWRRNRSESLRVVFYMLDWLMTLPNTRNVQWLFSLAWYHVPERDKCLRTQLKAAKAAFFALISVKLWWKAVFIRLNALNVLKSGKVIHLLIHLVIHLSYYKNEMFWLLIHLVIHFCAYFVLIKRGNIFFLFGIHRFL